MSWIQMWVEKQSATHLLHRIIPPRQCDGAGVCAFDCKHQITDDSLGICLCRFTKDAKDVQKLSLQNKNSHVTKDSNIFTDFNVYKCLSCFRCLLYQFKLIAQTGRSRHAASCSHRGNFSDIIGFHVCCI